MKVFIHYLLGPLIAAAMMGGLYATDSMHLEPADVGDYHQRVAAAIGKVPYVIGDWVGHDVPVPSQATQMLKPNAMVSRKYLNTATGQRVTILLIHTRDARDLIGHYPPECYPANGWNLTDRQAVDLPRAPDPAAASIEAGRYEFVMEHFTGRRHLDVLNLMVLPTGRYSIGMAGLSGVSGDYRVRHFGGAALQFVFNQPMPEARQKQVFALFFDALEPALNTVRNGVEREARTPGGRENPEDV